ncbi:MAG: hypothetical protein KKD64_15295 [Alphaproteobacteria bacterium]|uniref:Uncharacterized protein n=1 Tax=viral metagenome TaxID=1070528 RepID=A0A6M3M6D1_9ZZZZ|nr:hypothetical protein [Alphaproteobacteria bacterium]MBU0876112.1 hypothetical protein [Alphaproteobacteria bacterium]MBU1771003.1 hypothetical protein [Alphaproteobacteria bacterium]
MWLYAFDDKQLIADLCNVLVETGAMAATDRPGLVACGPFVALHALTLMHRSCLKLPDEQLAPLRVAVREETGTLRIKADIPVKNISNPIGCSVTVFETGLDAATHCEPRTLADPELLAGPLEVDREGRLASLG